MPDSVRHTHINRLSREKSPYLLQHAHNPVDWFAWGAEAFAKAKKEDKPVFLSIGYSTCHWCHVMEEESFENEALAKILNEHFVAIKVDREERPDIDHIYMSAVQAMTGAGGWPLSVFLLPDQKPFYGGTYLPPEDRWGRSGFRTLLLSISDIWKKKRDELERSAESLTSALKTYHEVECDATVAELSGAPLKRGFQQLSAHFDHELGGFGVAPKFPRSHTLSFLLRYWKRTNDAHALTMVTRTLDAMARGGICDQLGGGFHRYATDAEWHVPHFEKMLYDQALLAWMYLEAYQATTNETYRGTARNIFDYVLGDLEHPAGGFYSAEDADSLDAGGRKTEGAFYVWEKKEIDAMLDKDQAGVFHFIYGVDAVSNVKSDPQGEFVNKNVLFRAHTLEEAGTQFKKSPEEIARLLNSAQTRLLEIRNKRLPPHLDDKILTDWNGLMISALAFGARVLDEPKYRDAAERAAQFILKHLRTGDGRLLHRFRDGEAAISGTLDDYAFFANGLFDLYEATFDVEYLETGLHLLSKMDRLFLDELGRGYFMTALGGEQLIHRPKEFYDGAVPSGNAVAACALLRYGRLTMNQKMETRGRDLLGAFLNELENNPTAYTQHLIALDFATGPAHEIVLAEGSKPDQIRELTKVLYARFVPNKVVALRPANHDKESQARVFKLMPFIEQQVPVQEKDSVYVCKDYACALPVTEPRALEALLAQD